MKNKIDAIDLGIAELLSEDAQMPYTEIAKRLIISSGTVHARVKKMVEIGFILGSTLKLDYAKIGSKMTIFLAIFLDKSSHYKSVIDELTEIDEVVKVHHVSGKYDIFIKMHAIDSVHYRNIYQDKILTIKGIKGVEPFISLEENLNRHIPFRDDEHRMA